MQALRNMHRDSNLDRTCVHENTCMYMYAGRTDNVQDRQKAQIILYGDMWGRCMYIPPIASFHHQVAPSILPSFQLIAFSYPLLLF